MELKRSDFKVAIGKFNTTEIDFIATKADLKYYYQICYLLTEGKNVYSGAAGDGAGVTRASMCGTFLADWVCGRDREELRYMHQCDAPSYVLQNHLEQLVLQLVLFGKICTHEARSKRKEAVYLYVIHC